MSRALPEWVGKTDDTPVPARVRLRIFQAFDGRCQCGCGRKIATGERWDAEDAVAIINGGERRESNLRPFLAEHHPQKTARDVAIKSKTYAMGRKHAGIRTRKARPMPFGRESKYKKKVTGEIVLRGTTNT